MLEVTGITGTETVGQGWGYMRTRAGLGPVTETAVETGETEMGRRG